MNYKSFSVRLFRAECKPLSATFPGPEDLIPWLVNQAQQYELDYLLAHADDGVIWGRFTSDSPQRLVTSFDAVHKDPDSQKYCPELRLETLQQARLFSASAEVFLWRIDQLKWRARLIQEVAMDEPAEWEQGYDERQMLWGDHAQPLEDGFALLSDGAQGLRHVIPIPRDQIPNDQGGNVIPPRLVVRHYLNRSDFARVTASRLVGFEQV